MKNYSQTLDADCGILVTRAPSFIQPEVEFDAH
jgi:hypothetical protein